MIQKENTIMEPEAIKPAKKGSILKYVLALLMSLVAVYAIGAFYYSSHFSHNTIINNVNVGGLSPKEAAKTVAEHTKEYQLKIKEKDNTEVIKGEDINLSLDMTNEVNDLFKKYNPFLWPKNLFSKEKANVMGHVSFDEQLLDEQIVQLHCLEDGEKAKDAYIKLEGDQYVIIPEEEGTMIDKNSFKEAVATSIQDFKDELDLEKEDLYEKAEINQENTELKAACDQANAYAKAKITYLPESQEEILSFEKTKDWIIMKKMKVSLDETKVLEYVNTLAEKYDNDEGAVRFTTHNGEEKEFRGEDFTWKVDKEKEKEAIINALKAGQEVSREPVFSTSGKFPLGKGVGKNYAEVSISAQHVWLYKDGFVLSESDVSIGNIDKGLFFVNSKSSDKIKFHNDQGFMIKSTVPTTTEVTTQTTTETEPDEENEDETTEATTATTAYTQPTIPQVSDNVECPDNFFKNLSDNLAEGIPVVVY